MNLNSYPWPIHLIGAKKVVWNHFYLQPLHLIGAGKVAFNFRFYVFFSLVWIYQSQFKFQHPNWIWSPIHDPYIS
jgi:hypothetical protein